MFRLVGDQSQDLSNDSRQTARLTGLSQHPYGFARPCLEGAQRFQAPDLSSHLGLQLGDLLASRFKAVQTIRLVRFGSLLVSLS